MNTSSDSLHAARTSCKQVKVTKGIPHPKKRVEHPSLTKRDDLTDGGKSLDAKSGFALIASLSIMAFLVLIGVALFSLSTAASRNAQLVAAQTKAKANAQTALMIAIGELQQYAGADTRITASADLLDEDLPLVTGVWRSWEGSDHEPSGNLAGRPIPPDYPAKESHESNGGRFLTWLISGEPADPTASPIDQITDRASKNPDVLPGAVPLLTSGLTSDAAGSLEADDPRGQVHVVPTELSESGRYAWWCSGENQKARLPAPYSPEDSVVGWSDLLRSHAVADPEPFGLDDLLANPATADKIHNLASTALIPDTVSSAALAFHDLSTSSVGLLTNVATGGWRKDLSLLTETWEEQPQEDLALFQLSQGKHQLFNRAIIDSTRQILDARRGSNTPENSLFYHWSDYRYPSNSNASKQVFHRRGPVSSWTGLANFATLYKDISVIGGRPSIQHQSWNYWDATGLHRTWVMPQFARVQVIASHYATANNATPGNLKPAVLLTPIVTLWNPYDVRIILMGSLHVRTGGGMPIALKYNIPGAINSDHWAIQKPDGSAYGGNHLQNGGKTYLGWQLRFSESPLILNPGETRVYSPRKGFINNDTYLNNYSTVEMAPGVRLDTGTYYTLDRLLVAGLTSEPTDPAEQDQVSLPPATMLNVEEAKFDVPSRRVEIGPVGGIFFQWNIGGFADPQHGNVTAQYRPEDADNLYPPITNLASVSLAECQDNPIPFLSLIFGSRIANDRATATKGLVQANPLVTFTATGLYQWFADLYPGGGNPLNSPWDFSFVAHTSGPGDDMLPNVDSSTNSGYIITGLQSGTGIARSVLAELPGRPLASLGDLTHWTLRGLNPIPPHGTNYILNSDATPLIPQDDVVDRAHNTYAGSINNEQQDDSYCANHLLFDDWFFSSIAPEPRTFGPVGKTLEANYIEFLTGEDPLTNRAYRPITEDRTSDQSVARQTYTEQVEPLDSWQTIASRLEVEGMFNVNSTSVKAWRALLGQARNKKIPYFEDNGGTTLSAETDYAFSRTSIAGHAEAGTAYSGKGILDTPEFAGYRVLDDVLLYQLAEEIVKQIRRRGPFLSLSEFINRQLSADTDLALAGAVQAALNALPDVATDPFASIKIIPSIADPLGDDDDYVFDEAAVGYNTYGLPGWTRQADVLRPLAPILSARDDTFTIRTYGDVISPVNGAIEARAWCEAVVRRTRDYVNPADDADITSLPTNVTNQSFGRRFEIVSFRWLDEDEV